MPLPSPTLPPIEQTLSSLVVLDEGLGRQRERLAGARESVDASLAAIDLAIRDVNAALASFPALSRNLSRRMAQPDLAVELAADAPGWAPVEVSVGRDVVFSVVIEEGMDDPVTSSLAMGRVSEKHLVQLMLDNLRPGDRLLDLGSHVGVFSLAAAASGCEVLAVEASPGNAAALRASAVRNGFHRLHVANVAVTDVPGHISFEVNGPWGHVVWGEEAAETTVSVPGFPVASLLDAFGWSSPDFIKMDVEGSEPKAIAGMRQVLSPPDAPPILFESNARSLDFAGATAGGLRAQLAELDYTSYLVEPGRLTRLSASDLQAETVVDCLAVKGEPPALAGWEVVPMLTAEDSIRRIVAESRNANPYCRAFIARSLETIDPALARDPAILEAIRRLAEDPVKAVRDAAAWSAAAR